MAEIRTLPVSYLSDVTVGGNTLEAGAVTGAKASAALKTKSMQSVVPTIPTAAGTTEVCVLCPFTGTVTGIRFTNKNALAANDTNFLTFAIVNKGQAGAGNTPLLAATDANTTKATGGSAIGAYTTRQLTNHGTAGNMDVSQGDTLAVQFTGAGTLANTLTQGYIQINMTVDT